MSHRSKRGRFMNGKQKQANHKREYSCFTIPDLSDGQWRVGRRVVEPGLLSDELICDVRQSLLHLRFITSETKQGRGSILYVKCQNCSTTKSVLTGKRHSGASGPGGDASSSRVFDINTKLTAAMINAGIGETQINNILAEQNIPHIHHATLKRREREIGNVFKSVAAESCSQAIIDKIESIQHVSDLTSSTHNIQAEVSIDGGWQRRGNGRSGNSLSGHVTVVGKYTKRCVGFSTAKKQCRRCASKVKSRKTMKSHDCRLNWSGSAKAMEPFLAVKCLKEFKDRGLNVDKITMDDDSTTLIRARKYVNPNLEKSSVSNHVFKNFTSTLMEINKKHKVSHQVAVKLSTDFSYAVKQNSTDKIALKNNLQAIIPHAFGDHSLCSDKTWCRYEEKQEEYRHKRLPSGKDLSGESLRISLQKLMGQYTTDDMLHKLSELQSSNTNENLNQIIARKAPKSQHYSPRA